MLLCILDVALTTHVKNLELKKSGYLVQQLWGDVSFHPLGSSRYQTPHLAGMGRNNCC